jgi:hypothetical protein
MQTSLRSRGKLLPHYTLSIHVRRCTCHTSLHSFYSIYSISPLAHPPHRPLAYPSSPTQAYRPTGKPSPLLTCCSSLSPNFPHTQTQTLTLTQTQYIPRAPIPIPIPLHQLNEFSASSPPDLSPLQPFSRYSLPILFSPVPAWSWYWGTGVLEYWGPPPVLLNPFPASHNHPSNHQRPPTP